MKKVINHCIKWNEWRKHNLGSLLYKVLVLIGFIHSPTFEIYLTDAQVNEIIEEFKKVCDYQKNSK